MLAKTAREFIEPYPAYEGLTPSQADQAKSFLSSILLASKMAKHAGVQVDITKWIKAYRGHVGRNKLPSNLKRRKANGKGK